MKRDIRYQAAVMQGASVLIIRHTHHADGLTYWALPGGGREEGETEEACVAREVLEETGLEVRVERLLVDEEGRPEGIYPRLKTYLCTPLSGVARPGYEPEADASALYAITDVAWLDLRDPDVWGDDLKTNLFLFPALMNLRAILVGPAP